MCVFFPEKKKGRCVFAFTKYVHQPLALTTSRRALIHMCSVRTSIFFSFANLIGLLRDAAHAEVVQIVQRGRRSGTCHGSYTLHASLPWISRPRFPMRLYLQWHGIPSTVWTVRSIDRSIPRRTTELGEMLLASVLHCTWAVANQATVHAACPPPDPHHSAQPTATSWSH